MYDDRWMTVADAATCCLACCDAGDPQGNKARIVALIAASALPLTLPEDAPLAARLASWEAAPRRPRMAVHSGAEGQTSSFSTSFTAPPPTYTPDRADLDGLVALLDDSHPSRWLDFSGARTVGDNAWRALATILHCDPRVLSGYPTGTPWTATERHQAALAFQLWWKDHRTAIPDPPLPAEPAPAAPASK